MSKYLVLSVLFAISVMQAQAGGGHDHGDGGHSHDAPPIVITPGSPQRLPDGSVSLPKPSQRFIQVRTLPVKLETLPRSQLLHGKVVAGVNAINKVRALQAGRLDIPRGSLPAIGDRIKKGKKLATIRFVGDVQEGVNQAAEVADLREQLKLAKLEARRLEKLGELIPRREIDAAQANVRALRARIAAFSKSVGKVDTLFAPISGIVSGSYASAGQAVQAGDLLLEIIDPGKLQVEAMSYDTALPDKIASASLRLGDKTLQLRFQGASQQLRLQALPVRFSIVGDIPTGLAAGLPVQVLVQSRETSRGIAVPVQALERNPANQNIVWVKTAPELYAPRKVQYLPLDGERVIITAGLKAGDRVVVQGANLINQIR